MRKSAFTLIEMILSIVILFIVMTMFSNLSGDVKQKISYYGAKKSELQGSLTTYQALFNDIFLADEIVVRSNPNYDILFLTTKNSMYGVANPNVIWYTLKDGKRLVRLESKIKLEPPFRVEMIPFIHSDVFESDVASFKVLKHRRDNKYFVSIDKPKNRISLSVAK